ncbi:MAG: DUF1800 domain-containing protein, partial [Chloroflexota bacterium]|nr:DUF1800 domain-containing protein [Chloroflexota bacterium]
HDTGVKTILGRTANFDGKDVIKHLVQQPAAAHFLSRELFEFFVYPDPSVQDLEPLVTAYTRTNGDVKAMLRALFTAPVFYSPKAYRSKIKSPVELAVGTIRALNVATDGFQLPGATTRMGQALFNPPNVAGWPGGVNWINSSTWMERVNFGNFVVTAREDGHTMAPAFAAIIERNGLTSPEAIVDYFGSILLDGQISAGMRQTLLAYLTGGDLTGAPAPAGLANGKTDKGKTAAGKSSGPKVGATKGAARTASNPALPAFVDQKVRGVVYLMLASPEYQMA